MTKQVSNGANTPKAPRAPKNVTGEKNTPKKETTTATTETTIAQVAETNNHQDNENQVTDQQPASELANEVEKAEVANEEIEVEAINEAPMPEGESSVEDPSELTDEEFDKGHRDGIIKVEDENDEGQLFLNENNEVEVDKENPMLKDSENKVEVAPFSRLTKIEKSTNNVSVKSLFKEWKKDQQLKLEGKVDETTLRFDLAIQRNDVWTDAQRSDLIHSILYGYYIPPVLVKDTSDGKKWFLDGKQRITTIMTFVNGDWALNKKTEDVYGHKIAGFKFKDLSEEMQDEILDETITLVRMKNMTDAERDKMFVKLNSGSSLSRIELTRAKHSELITSINELSNLPFFKEGLDMSKKARVRFVDQEIILQIAMLFEEGKEKIKGFGASHIEEYVLRLKESEKTLSDEMIKRFKDVSAYLNLAFEDFETDEIKKALKKIHVPIIFWNAEIAIENKLNPTVFGDFIRSFLITNYSVYSDYGKSCQSGSSKKENVLTRLDEMHKALMTFIDMIRGASSLVEGVNAFDKHLAEANGISDDDDEDNE